MHLVMRCLSYGINASLVGGEAINFLIATYMLNNLCPKGGLRLNLQRHGWKEVDVTLLSSWMFHARHLGRCQNMD